jgi:hypothetical protein
MAFRLMPVKEVDHVPMGEMMDMTPHESSPLPIIYS